MRITIIFTLGLIALFPVTTQAQYSSEYSSMSPEYETSGPYSEGEPAPKPGTPSDTEPPTDTETVYEVTPGLGYFALTDFNDPVVQNWLPPSPLPAPVYGAGPSGTGTGHAGPPDPYNIYIWNCHSNTNLCTLSAPASETRGALVCHSGAINTPAHHSASWATFNLNGVDWSCIYNYGRSCCWQAAGDPPDISSGDGRTCAQWACGTQYNAGQTQTLPAGQLVEVPGYSACVREIVTAPNDIGVSAEEVSTALDDAMANQVACRNCCDRRGSLWDHTGFDVPAMVQDFMTHCYTMCDGFFANGASTGTQYGSSECVPSTTFWSVHSRYEQCRGCCLDGAVDGSYGSADVNDCLAVCRQAYP
jgi:hypothetical protein